MRPYEVLEFSIPRAATADGNVTLTWRRTNRTGGSGRDNQIAEVWLMKERP